MIAKLRLAQVKTVSLFYLHLNISRVSLCAVMLRVSQINYDFILYIYSFTSTEKTKENQHDEHQVETLPTTAVKRLRQHSNKQHPNSNILFCLPLYFKYLRPKTIRHRVIFLSMTAITNLFWVSLPTKWLVRR